MILPLSVETLVDHASPCPSWKLVLHSHELGICLTVLALTARLKCGAQQDESNLINNFVFISLPETSARQLFASDTRLKARDPLTPHKERKWIREKSAA